MKKNKKNNIYTFRKGEYDLFFSRFIAKTKDTDKLKDLVEILEWIKLHDDYFVNLFKKEINVLSKEPMYVSGTLVNQTGSIILQRNGVKMIPYEDYEDLIMRVEGVAKEKLTFPQK